METIKLITDGMNAVAYNKHFLFVILFAAVLYTAWSIFVQFRSLTHGAALVAGKYNTSSGRGALSHFQALSTALSGTVGLGNIGGVAIAISIGGPGAVFWMWIIGFFGMALKATEVMLSMMYRDMSDPDAPRGGPMWVVERAFASWNEDLRRIGTFIGVIFAGFVILSAMAAGNAFQSFSAADITNEYFGVPMWATSLVLALLVGAVILGGVRRIGAFASFVVPFMCLAYFIAGIYVLVLAGGDTIADIFSLIFTSAFSASEATGAFAGATFGAMFIMGMKRALFSSEAGAGSAPMAHSAVRTKEPVSEGIVAGLEPFIDTLVICTITALVILSSGTWNRADGPELQQPVALVKVATPAAKVTEDAEQPAEAAATDAASATTASADAAPEAAAEKALPVPPTGPEWTIADTEIPKELYDDWPVKKGAFVIVSLDGSTKPDSIVRLEGKITERKDKDDNVIGQYIAWGSFTAKVENVTPEAEEGQPTPEPVYNILRPTLLTTGGVYRDYISATVTAKAFDKHVPGLGKWLITLAVLLFALSTIISWSYYGEQALSYIFGRNVVITLIYRLIYVMVVVVSGFWVGTNSELDNITAAPFGMMILINIPITLMFGYQAMREYRAYCARLEAGLIEKK